MTLKTTMASKHSMMKKKNLRLIIEHFRETACSTFQIGREIGLSSGGAKKLVDEIAESGLIARVPPERRYKSGRTPLSYRINADYCRLAVINYTDETVSLLDLRGNRIAGFSMRFSGNPTDEDIRETARGLKRLLAEHDDGIPLKAISIVYVGRFDGRFNHHFSSKFRNCTINLYEYYKKEFGVDVVFYNDLQFALIAERKNGVLNGTETSACFLNVGRGVSAGILIRDQLYVGASGIAGEIGQNLIIGDVNGGTINEDFISWLRIKRRMFDEIKAGTDTILQEGFSHRDAIDAYKQGDVFVKSHIDTSAKNLARLIKNIVDFMDFDVVILTGKMIEFGDTYYQLVQDEFAKLGSRSVNGQVYSHVKIVRSERSEDEGISIGAYECACDAVFDRVVTELSEIKND